MTQQDIEIILSRHWASHLDTPVFLVDVDGRLLFYNESAEPILGRRFAQSEKMGFDEWSTAFRLSDDDHRPLAPEEVPLTIALNECRPVHCRLWLVGLDNIERHIETTCFPLIGQADRFLGALAIFWELPE